MAIFGNSNESMSDFQEGRNLCENEPEAYVYDSKERRVVEKRANWTEAADVAGDMNEQVGEFRYAAMNVDDERLDR